MPPPLLLLFVTKFLTFYEILSSPRRSLANMALRDT